ncbi:MAG: tripartite tricarboxylate transporter TctB family protein [Alphaproteobacteria bacterium]|nr:tripartite tricarboxylate transporter TctB family protein [Alphaproteobacteria bacterium]
MADRQTRRPGELVFAGLLLAFSAAALWQSYEISGFSGLTTAGVFPMLASGTALAAGLVILLDVFRKRPIEGHAPVVARRFLTEVLTGRLVLTVALIAAYVAAMPWFGFLAASGAFLFAAFALLWRRGWITSLALTAVSLAAVYVIFRVVFQVVLPQGTLIQGLI